MNDSATGYDPDNIGERPGRFVANEGMRYAAIKTPTASLSGLSGVESWSGTLAAPEASDSPWYLHGRTLTQRYLKTEEAFGWDHTRQIVAGLDSALQGYNPSIEFNRLDAIFRLPTADEVENLIHLIEAHCARNKK